MARRREGKRKQKSVLSGEGRPEESERKRGLTRRDFIIRAGEAAAFALFGVTALDPIIEKVLARLDSWESTSRIARRVQQKLIESGLGGKAWADSCSPYACSPYDHFCLGQASQYTCTAPSGQAYKCESFWCRDLLHSFNCQSGTGHSDTWFGCGVDDPTGGKFLCKPNATAADPFACAGVGKPVTADFHCADEVKCLHPGGSGEFGCGGNTADPYFDCTNQPGTLHYKCPKDQGDVFSCPPENENATFNCTAGYVNPEEEPPPPPPPPPP